MAHTDLGYERPLFAGYAIGMEFEKRWMELDVMLAGTAANADGSAVVDRIQNNLTLCPIQLLRDKISVRVISTVSDPEGSAGYEYQIPYQGDGELWALTPSGIPTGWSQPEGEIHRGRLIIICLYDTKAEADEWLNLTLDEVEVVLELQAREVEAFNEMLPALIWQKLIQYRTGAHVPMMADTAH